MASLALVLFDIDGCTAIVNSRKLSFPKELMKGQQAHIRLRQEKLKVEVLELSDSITALDEFEEEWSMTERSLALDQEKKRRKNRPHGYLDVCSNDRMQKKQTEKTYPRILKGLNGNQIEVLYEGSGDCSGESAEPRIGPCHFEGLTENQIAYIKRQMEAHRQGKL